mmetsp:Transcript_74394/g.103366  ORF Transcript_74394/g.103366 Transcript_74394/m.103366 type:complete len:201 (+) Transcript_74394:37-639(+)
MSLEQVITTNILTNIELLDKVDFSQLTDHFNSFLRVNDPASDKFKYIYSALLLAMNAIHTYAMVIYMEYWAEYSLILYYLTGWQYLQSTLSWFLMLEDEKYILNFKWLRVISLIAAWVTMSNYVIGLISIGTYLAEEEDWAHTALEIAFTFIMLGYSTIIMPSVYIIFKESGIDDEEFRQRAAQKSHDEFENNMISEDHA